MIPCLLGSSRPTGIVVIGTHPAPAGSCSRSATTCPIRLIRTTPRTSPRIDREPQRASAADSVRGRLRSGPRSSPGSAARCGQPRLPPGLRCGGSCGPGQALLVLLAPGATAPRPSAALGTASDTAAMLTAGGPGARRPQDLAASVAAFGGAAGESMVRATRRAEQRAARLITQAAEYGQKAPARRPVAKAGLGASPRAISRFAAAGGRHRPGAAWLTVALRDLRVRDDAWARMDPEHRAEHITLWAGLTRRAQPGYVAARRRCWRSAHGRTGTEPWPTSRWTGRWPMTRPTRWPCCSGR